MHSTPSTRFLLILVMSLVAIPLQTGHAQDQSQTSVALTGQVTSTEEGPMEGVLVTAKGANSPIAVTVVSGEQGRYRFPSAKLQPGHYTITIRAVGYDLDSPAAIDITAQKTATDDLKLR